ncbi:TetR/AcrR family transcriptional regulator [Mycobacterium sp. CVI_P3]|uniref:TetR/AcrR family transcriptional regulator n=1 Tax=Mycobacterium pinniadriaticum TaxID=2994102 RepID=A0ABT3SK56_9MYCO|nr:TetR/AcrR family transcriptional regulator [Mycobacterium pinniadriaticum]MCX2933461.1 TetR/AcrR family transcriptional regulator [Mycobacterium pinniadriaticum]MCX2939900.1 TetR/AcrR family transcriptional regulator [Mycobacterium pinniadriaticum]
MNSTPCKVRLVPAATPARVRGRRATRPSGDDREAAILRTLEDMLEQRPFAEISVDDLAKGAGLSRPTFYFYFASKDAVLVRLFGRAITASGADRQQQTETADQPPQQAWHDGIYAFFDSLRPHRTVVLAGLSAMAANPELREMWTSFMTGWIDYTAALITKERMRGAAPDTIPAHDLATALNLMNERVVFAAQGSQKPTLPENAALEALAHIWIASIYGEARVSAASV